MERQSAKPDGLVDSSHSDAAHALRGTGACLHLALDAAGMAWWQWDLVGGQKTGDPRCRQLLGLEPASGYEEFLERLHPEDRGPLKQKAAQACARPGDYEHEFRVANGAGGWRWVLVKGRSLAGPGGAPTQLVGILTDSTARKLAEEELAQEHDLLRTLIDQLPLCVYVKDAQGRFVAANAATARIMGAAAPEDLLGKSDAAFYPRRAAEEYGADELAILRGEKVVVDKDEPHVDPAGECREILTTKLPFRDAHGKIVGLVGISRDITEQKRAQQELAEAKATAEAASAAKSEFLASMSHELRTPMTAVLGFAELMGRPECSAEERAEYGAILQQSGRALLQLIDGVLDLARIEAGKTALDAVEFSPCRLVEEVVSLMRVSAEQKRLPLDVRYLTAIPPLIRSDPAHLRQILLNLLGNAVKFTERGEIQLRVSFFGGPAGGRMLFAVADTGIGMRREELAMIFQPFGRTDSSRRRSFAGTGLGLAISRRLARLLGGDITVESGAGAGSTFLLSIDAPRSGPASPSSAPRAFEPPAPPSAGKPMAGRVLLVEDTPGNRHLIDALLTKAGLGVETAADGEEACQKAEASRAAHRPYDLILMDIQMPRMDGHRATARLRELGWRGPIVALTACAMSGDRQRCLAAGCDDYLAKPISRASLLEMVARWLPS